MKDLVGKHQDRFSHGAAHLVSLKTVVQSIWLLRVSFGLVIVSDILQAPDSLKTVVQSIWLLTVSFGDLVVIIVANIQAIPSQVSVPLATHSVIKFW